MHPALLAFAFASLVLAWALVLADGVKWLRRHRQAEQFDDIDEIRLVGRNARRQLHDIDRESFIRMAEQAMADRGFGTNRRSGSQQDGER